MALALWLPHAFPGTLFINPLCVQVVFESSSNVQYRNCNFIIPICCSMYRLHTAARKSESVRVYLQRRLTPTDLKNLLIFIHLIHFLYILYIQDIVSLSSRTCPQFFSVFHFFNQTCNKTWIYFVYIWSSCVKMIGPLSWSLVHLLEFSNLTYNSTQILANITANWKNWNQAKL